MDNRADTREAQAEAAFPPDGQILSIGAQKVHAVVQGSGPDLVLIHGASGNTRDFTFAFADRMAQQYRVIALDRPGFGWSTPLPRDADTILDQARLLQAAAAQLGADKPVVLGHSYGGAVALAWATSMPDTLAALVPLAAPSMEWEGGISGFYKATSSTVGGATLVPLITAFVGENTVKSAIRGIFKPQPAPEGYAAYVGAPLSLRRDTLRVNAQQRARLKGEIRQMMPFYAQTDLPVEIVHGTADTTVGAQIHAVPLHDILPNSDLTLLEGIGHMPQHGAPEAVEAAINRAARRAGLR